MATKTKTNSRAKRVFFASDEYGNDFSIFNTLREVKDFIFEQGWDPEQCNVYEATIRYKVKVGEMTFTKAESL